MPIVSQGQDDDEESLLLLLPQRSDSLICSSLLNVAKFRRCLDDAPVLIIESRSV